MNKMSSNILRLFSFSPNYLPDVEKMNNVAKLLEEEFRLDGNINMEVLDEIR
jgi:hypothetical protein